MRLVCKKYRWYDVSLGENEVNFFSYSPKTLVETIDLKYYLIKDSLSEFEWGLESINEVTNGLEIKMSNVTFQCKNEILGRTSLQDFFEVYNNNDKIKFRFEYYNDNNDLLFSGLIYKDGVEFSSRSNDTLDIIAVSEEKEFIDYFSKKELVYPAGWTWFRLGTLLGVTGTGRVRKLYDEAAFRLIDLLIANFSNVEIGGIPSTRYYIVKRPYTYTPLTAGHLFKGMYNLLHIRTGIEQFMNDGVKMYDYFSSLFQAKGWIWFFSKGRLYIRDRSNTGLSTTSIDYSTEVLSHSVSSDILDKQVDNVSISNGGYFDNNSSQGALNFTSEGNPRVRRYVGGDVRMVYAMQEYSNKSRPFVNFQYSNPTPQQNIYRIYWTSVNLVESDFSIYQQDTDRDFIRKRIRLTGSNSFPTYLESILSLSKQRALNIEPAIVSNDNASGIDLNNAGASDGAYYSNGNFYKAARPTTDSNIYYTGNPASSMIRYNSDDGYYYTYERDCESAEFVNNFKKFIRSANPVIFDIEVKKKITDPFQNIEISNYPYKETINNKTFSIQKLSYNDITKISKLTLQML